MTRTSWTIVRGNYGQRFANLNFDDDELGIILDALSDYTDNGDAGAEASEVAYRIDPAGTRGADTGAGGGLGV